MTPRRARRVPEDVRSMDLQVPLLAAKALLLLLLFAFIYAVVWRGIGDLRSVPEDETFVAGKEPQTDDPPDRPERRPKSSSKIFRHGGLLYVEDAGSTNGTFVNDRKAVGATPLSSGDRVRVGSTTFRYSE